MIVYRVTDRIPVKVGELKFWLSPLSYEQKVNLAECTKMKGGEEVVDTSRRAFLAIKYAIKGVEGLKCPDGSDYLLSFEPSGVLSDESVSDIVQLDGWVPLAVYCVQMMNGISDGAVPGVEVDLKGVVSAKKKD